MSTVVIIGRKNVGKSTIFNRLIGMRANIVLQEPGITRDRVYGDVVWCNQHINIIDTGGFFPDEDSFLSAKINQQIAYGLAEADLVYFVVDGKDGLKINDENISKYLRKSGKQVFLLINKIDSNQAKLRQYEFSKLGYDNVFCVSAEAGIGFGDVLDKTLEILPVSKKTPLSKRIRVLILGRPNAGKSTLLNALVRQERSIVDKKPGTTRDLVHARFNYQHHDIEIIDTCGLRRRSKIKTAVEFYSMIRAVNHIERADIALVLFDTATGVVEQDRRIASMVLSKAKGLIVVPNKIDLIQEKYAPRIINSTKRSFRALEFVPITPISAKARTGILKLLTAIIKVHDQYGKTVEKKSLKQLIKKMQAPTNGSLINLQQMDTKPPVFKATLSNRVKNHYIKYLRNVIRQHYDYSGVPILIKTRIIKKLRARAHSKV